MRTNRLGRGLVAGCAWLLGCGSQQDVECAWTESVVDLSVDAVGLSGQDLLDGVVGTVDFIGSPLTDDPSQLGEDGKEMWLRSSEAAGWGPFTLDVRAAGDTAIRRVFDFRCMNREAGEDGIAVPLTVHLWSEDGAMDLTGSGQVDDFLPWRVGAGFDDVTLPAAAQAWAAGEGLCDGAPGVTSSGLIDGPTIATPAPTPLSLVIRAESTTDSCFDSRTIINLLLHPVSAETPTGSL